MSTETPPKRTPNRTSKRKPAAPAEAAAPEAERIAKYLARAGVCSRRDAEKLIAEGKVAVDGIVLESPAYKVTGAERITVEGRVVASPDRPRLWRFNKPRGLVVSHKDDQGRLTIFDMLKSAGLPRVISIGRLDLNSEGLLLLTNDGGLARRLELPENAWVRRYKVRVAGEIDPRRLEALKQGITVEGVHYGPIEVEIDRVGGLNGWLYVSLTEGKNREIRKVLEHLGLSVNRLQRVSYGPFDLGKLELGDVAPVAGVMVDKILRGEEVTFETPARLARQAPARDEAGEDKPAPKRGRAAADGKRPARDAETPEGWGSARKPGGKPPLRRSEGPDEARPPRGRGPARGADAAEGRGARKLDETKPPRGRAPAAGKRPSRDDDAKPSRGRAPAGGRDRQGPESALRGPKSGDARAARGKAPLVVAPDADGTDGKPWAGKAARRPAAEDRPFRTKAGEGKPARARPASSRSEEGAPRGKPAGGPRGAKPGGKAPGGKAPSGGAPGGGRGGNAHRRRP